jgi:predicted nucleic acid-binding protein
LDADTPENASVTDALNEILRDETILMPTILQMEVVHYCHLSVADSRSVVQRFLGLEDTEVPSLTPRDVGRASDVLAENPATGVGGRDASVLAIMRRCGATTLWTHDSDLFTLASRMDWLDVHDPVSDHL